MKKNSVRLLIAVIVGLSVAGISIYYLLNFASTYQEMTEIVTPKKDIEAYEVLTAENLGMKSVPKGSVGKYTAVDPGQVVGKATTTPLYSGSWIDLRNLTDKELVDTEKQHIALNINLTRSVGGTIKPGDIVDVYYVVGEQVSGAVLAENCRVLKLMDSMGNSIGKNTNISGMIEEVAKGDQKAGLPAVVVLAVEPDTIPNLTRGSFDKSAGIVLVKKFKMGGGNDSAERFEIHQETEGEEKRESDSQN